MTSSPKQKDRYQVSLKAILRNGQGEVLALRALTDDGGAFAGFYDLPGGRIDTDEFAIDFKEIIAREIREEAGDIKFQLNEKPAALGRHTSQGRVDSTGHPYRALYVFFEGEYQSGEITISEEHLDYTWLKLEEIELEKYFTSGILEGLKMYITKNDR